jgi:hypothetical protein
LNSCRYGQLVSIYMSSLAYLGRFDHMSIRLDEDGRAQLDWPQVGITMRMYCRAPWPGQWDARLASDRHSRPPIYPSLSKTTMSPTSFSSGTPILSAITLAARLRKNAVADPLAPAPTIAIRLGRSWLMAPSCDETGY